MKKIRFASKDNVRKADEQITKRYGSVFKKLAKYEKQERKRKR